MNKNDLNLFKGKKVLITGGTGSFGKTICKHFLNQDDIQLRIFSRDEDKQDKMRQEFSDKRLSFFIGDIRDYDSIYEACYEVDYVFHAAALKQVPSCEFYPIEAVNTNVMGTENVLNAAIFNDVSKVVCLSTDKAVYPINAMGLSKAMMEKDAVAKSSESENTIICVTRYGNVLASRGSVIPLFITLIQNNKDLTITDPNMTRFIMTLDDAVNLVMFAFENGDAGDIFVQKAPSASVIVIADAIREILDKKNHPIRIIGTRHGEKKHETLLSNEEMASAKELKNYYRITADSRDLNYEKYFNEGEEGITKAGDYSSDSTTQLDVKGMKAMLSKLKFIQAASKGKIIDPEE